MEKTKAIESLQFAKILFPIGNAITLINDWMINEIL